jgi:hypothetical protein
MLPIREQIFLKIGRRETANCCSRQSGHARVGLPPMVWRILRGVSSVTAATTGLLLVYGVVYAMEGMTTRIPTSSLRELATTTLWMLPWILLYCSGLEDFVTVTRQASVFWLGLAPVLAFLYFYEGLTGSSSLTKVAMPLLAAVGGLLPHIAQRIRFVFTVLSLVAGIAGFVILCYTIGTLVSATTSFSTKGIAFVFIVFGTTSLTTGVLSIALLRRRRIEISA